MSDLQQSKATKLLASYASWNYSFNKKIRHKFRNTSKSFLANNDSIDYAFITKVAQKSKILHYVYFVAMLFIMWLIFRECIYIVEYYNYLEIVSNNPIYENFYTDIKTDAESVTNILMLGFLAWFVSFVYDILRYKKMFDLDDDLQNTDISNFRIPSSNQNICIFSGRKPFVGSGTISKNFSFVVATNKPKQINNNSELINFSEDEMYNTIQNTLSTKNNISQKLYINGSFLNGDTYLLSAIDSGKFDMELWQKYSEYNGNNIRRYICITNNSQSQEIQTNFFIRFVKSDNTLFVEITATLLNPIALQYRILEQLPQKISFTRLVLIFQNSIITAISNLVKSVFYTASFFLTLPERLFEKSRIKKQIQENPLFDYGETSTLREDIADNSLQTFYNSMDDDQLFKQTEKNIFDSLINFLESKNIDTSDLSQQQTTIINNGLMMSGGEIKADNLVAGKMAKFFGAKTK